ncbi:MAG: hypothetical protein LBS37_08345 [Treponema sp.]|jgi:hypothetical protein|nr:hypothetical protein [Treponema sp.]
MTGKNVRKPQRGLTFDDVWAAMMETDRKMQETARLIQELRDGHKESDRQMKDTKRLVRETSMQIKESDRQMEDTKRLVRETSMQIKETDRQLKESKKELDRKMGELGNRFGELAEHLVAPSIREKFNALGYHFEAASKDWEIVESDTVFAEIDILLANDDFTIAVEVKSKPVQKDVDAHIKRIEILRRYADKHHDARKIRGAIAGAIFSKNAKQYTLKQGFYVIEQTGDTVKIEAPEGFVPREW